ncbi:hypothetical protein ADIS_0009 [Lunatimonas lonarensis]|uniref:Uncharacterized protein n=1 Tax=Lunatimonas lonarensis TaxID=1232681 RepID=R7ZZB8_9BACT|nr:hypothetical protein ADIS_0009 [Lunatimonas lonarensis]
MDFRGCVVSGVVVLQVTGSEDTGKSLLEGLPTLLRDTPHEKF